MSVCLSFCLSVCLSVCMSVCACVCACVHACVICLQYTMKKMLIQADYDNNLKKLSYCMWVK